MNSTKTLVASLLIIISCIAGANDEGRMINNTFEFQAISMVKGLFDAIIDKKTLDIADEEYYFGIRGGILGESVCASLEEYKKQTSSSLKFDKKKSPLGILLSDKLFDILKDKQRFSFAYCSSVQTFDRNNVPRLGVDASLLLFVRAIPLTNDKYFNDIGNGVNFIFAFSYTSNQKDFIFIDLINSYVNGIPIYKILGFRGNYASGLKLNEQDIMKVFSMLKDTSCFTSPAR